MELLKTPAQKRKEARHKRVLDLYTTLYREHPNALFTTLCNTVSVKTGITRWGIVKILSNYGINTQNKEV